MFFSRKRLHLSFFIRVATGTKKSLWMIIFLLKYDLPPRRFVRYLACKLRLLVITGDLLVQFDRFTYLMCEEVWHLTSSDVVSTSIKCPVWKWCSTSADCSRGLKLEQGLSSESLILTEGARNTIETLSNKRISELGKSEGS